LSKISRITGIAVVLLALFLPTLTSRAQSKFDLGFRIGTNITTAFPTNSEAGSYLKISTNTRLLWGVASDFWLNRHSAISLQLLYDQKGASFLLQRLNSHNITITTTNDLRLDYLELPVLFHLRAGNSPLKFNASTGVSLGYLLGAHQNISGDTTTASDQYSKFDFSLVVGVGLSYSLTDHSLIYLDGAYTYGLTTPTPDNAYPSFVNQDLRLTAGMMWPFSL